MYIADLHIHSRYSRATSKDCTPEYLELWGARKGIGLIGTGDFTHPAWREELKEKLEPAGEGLYTLKEEYRIRDKTAGDDRPRFVVTGEISSIYKKGGRVRKVHSLILLPGLSEAEKLSRKLEEIGNIHSDGRPILGLDCKELLEITLELCPEAIYVPAHIWTPHFSLFGAFSGFDTVEECFEDLSPWVHAVETGLSSDPPMNWRVSALDRFQLISNSDAHSPAKLGREANLLEAGLSYPELKTAIETGRGLAGTIEFFPEEGKYHLDGHRKCGLCLTPEETEAYQGVCPVCGRKITIGVSHRVEQLADRSDGFVPEKAKGFQSLVPLPEVIGASMGCSSASVKAQKQYWNMLERLGAEFEILRNLPIEEIRGAAGSRITEGIRRLREGQVERVPGYDGEYGKIRLFGEEELSNTSGQMNFFSLLGMDEEKKAGSKAKKQEAERKTGGKAKEKPDEKAIEKPKKMSEAKMEAGELLNPEQEEAVRSKAPRIAVIAGPGTGKTKTLVSHISCLMEEYGVKPWEITAVTFTNQAAGELRERLRRALGKERELQDMQIGTFHSLCLKILREGGRQFRLVDETETLELAKELKAEYGLSEKPGEILLKISRWKNGEEPQGQETAVLEAYREKLAAQNAMDFDDLLLEALLAAREPGGQEWRSHFSYLCVDEFQDINPLQYQLLMAWNAGGRQLFAIGDPDQAIYGFRGSDAGCFRKLKEDGIAFEEIHLKENYRSGEPILQAAQAVIRKNPGERVPLHPNRSAQYPVRLVQAGTEMSEGIFVAKEINRLTGGIGMLEAQENSRSQGEGERRSFGEIAVLYRTHQEARLLENCLKKEGIPYVVAGREDFLKEDKVRGTIAFFRSLTCEKERALCLKLLWGLPEDEMSMEIYRNTADRYTSLLDKTLPDEILGMWMEDWGWTERKEMKRLQEIAVFYPTMEELLNGLLLGVESDLKRCGEKKYNGDAVTLMTLHGSKGLEFPAVILYGARKGQIPFESKKYETDLQEERRLFYVGMTRAKEELILTYSGELSPFLEELPEGLIEMEKAGSVRKAEQGHQMSLFEMEGFSD